MYHQDVYFKDFNNLIHSISTYKYRYMRKFEFFPKKKKENTLKNQLTQYNQNQKLEFSTISDNHLVTTSHIWSCHINISVVYIPNRQSIRIHFINAQCLWLHMKKTWWMHRKYQPNKWKRLFNWWTKRSNFSDKTV